MGIFQRKNGYYYLQFKGEGGSYQRVSLETKNKNLAQEIYQAFLLDKLKSKLIPKNKEIRNTAYDGTLRSAYAVSSPRYAVARAYTEYLESCKAKQVGAYTMQAKAKLLTLLLKHKIQTMDELNQQNINRLLESWQKTAKDTVIKHICNIKAFLNWAIKKRLYDRADYEALTFPNLKVGVRETTIPESDYQLILRASKDADFRLYLQTLWETGCRPKEILPLAKQDIDFAKGTAKIYQPKTKRHKTVYFRDELLRAFKAHPQDSLFEGAHRQGEYYAKKFQKLKEALGLPKEYCLYAFRHSFGTRMLNKTKDLHLVSRLLGHSNINITARHYINRDNETIRRQLMEAEE